MQKHSLSVRVVRKFSIDWCVLMQMEIVKMLAPNAVSKRKQFIPSQLNAFVSKIFRYSNVVHILNE